MREGETVVTIRIPAPSSMLVANVVAVLGVAAVVVAIGGLAGVWWAVLAGGLAFVALAAIAMTHMAAEQPVSVSGPVGVVGEKSAA